jgi:protein-S-isoprenylcysteine O-methyltransferase Ste14
MKKGEAYGSALLGAWLIRYFYCFKSDGVKWQVSALWQHRSTGKQPWSWRRALESLPSFSGRLDVSRRCALQPSKATAVSQCGGCSVHVSTLWAWLYWAWVTSEVLIAIATRTRHGRGEVKDRGTQLLLWIVIFASLTAAFWISHDAPAPMFGRAHWLRLIGLLILAAGLLIRWAAILNLGSAFSANIAIRDAQRVRTTGLYRFVRHPSYLGLVLIFLAVGFYSRNWISLAIALIPPTTALLYRIRVEEAALREAFGDEYTAYSRTTKRLVPGIY